MRINILITLKGAEIRRFFGKFKLKIKSFIANFAKVKFLFFGESQLVFLPTLKCIVYIYIK